MATGKLPVAPSIDFLLSLYETLEDFEKGYPRSEPVDADLDAWEEYVDEGMDHLADQLSFLEVTQEAADIGEEELDG